MSRTERPPLLGRLAPLAPVLATASVFALGELCLHLAHLRRRSLPLPGEWLELARAGSPRLGFAVVVDPLLVRVSWGFATLVYLVAWIAAVVGGVVVLYRLLSGRSARRLGLVAGALGVSLVGAVLRFNCPLQVGGVTEILAAAFRRLGIREVETLLALSQAFAVGAALLLLIAASATLKPSAATDNTEAGRELRRRQRLLQVVLYLGAVVLVAGTVQVVTVYQVPVPLLAGEAERAAMSRLAQGLSVATGGLWTLVLLAIYAPAALILRHRATRLAGHAFDSREAESEESWLEEMGLASSWTSQLARLAAVASPLLTSGPAALLIEALTGAGQ